MASAELSEDFYINCKDASGDLGEKDWELIRMEITLPESAQDKDIKVYVWNPDTTAPAYFDDLTIRFRVPEMHSQAD